MFWNKLYYYKRIRYKDLRSDIMKKKLVIFITITIIIILSVIVFLSINKTNNNTINNVNKNEQNILITSLYLMQIKKYYQ